VDAQRGAELGDGGRDPAERQRLQQHVDLRQPGRVLACSASVVGDTVLAVRANARAYADASDQIQNLVRVSSTDYYGAAKSPTTSYFSYGHIWQNNPATSAPWTPSEAINAGFGYRRV
jgi:hypothetical protein